MTPRVHALAVDGTNLAHRVYHTHPERRGGPDGRHVGAVVGFARSLNVLVGRRAATWGVTHAVVAFDRDGRTFRHDVLPTYKAGRQGKPDLAEQMPLIEELCRTLGLATVSADGWEADDLLASYTRAVTGRGGRVTIATSDKDMLQMVGEDVECWSFDQNKTVTAASVERRFGVPPSRMVDYLSLVGDGTDAVPGVPGIGKAFAVPLIRAYGSLEDMIAAARRSPAAVGGKRVAKALVEGGEGGLVARELVRLDRDARPDGPPSPTRLVRPDGDAMRDFMGHHGMADVAPTLARWCTPPTRGGAPGPG